MKNFFCVALALATPLMAQAQELDPHLAVPPPTPAVTTQLTATKTAFLTDFKEPRGLALGYRGSISVADYGAGEIVKFEADGGKRLVYSSGLQGPSDVANNEATSLVSETLNNRVLSLSMMILQVGDELPAPSAIIAQSMGGDSPFNQVFYVASATTGEIYRLAPVPKVAAAKSTLAISTLYTEYNWKLFYQMPAIKGKVPQIRDLGLDGNSLLVSDDSGRVQLLTSEGRAVTVAQGIESPTGIAVGADKNLYVCDDSGGGRLWQVDQNGEKTLVIGDLGQPYDIVFTDEATALISDKRGTVWKITLPSANAIVARN